MHDNADGSGIAPELFEVCRREATFLKSIDDFKEWTRDHVRPLLPHGSLCCVHGRIYGVGVSLDYVVTVDYPVSHLEAIRNPSGHMDTPLAHRWYQQQAPVFFDAEAPQAYIPASWLASFRMHDLRNAAAHGVMDQERCIATYFSFHRLPSLNETVLSGTFQHLIPLLHETFTRMVQVHQRNSTSLARGYAALSKRDRQLVSHISQGKGNAEIAALLHLSENTVRNQVSRILVKTGCSNRAALAAAAVAHEESFGMGAKIL